MPDRIFDGSKLREQRAAKRMSQASVAEVLGVKPNQVSKWENDQAKPPQERLPAIARAVGADLDELFPRLEPPNLMDLRCDAGMTRADTMEYTKTLSAMAVRAAEDGQRPLSQEHELALTEAYKVTLTELRAAQKRSFGHIVPMVPPVQTAPAVDRVVTERLAFVRDEVYNGHLPSDAEIASTGNHKCGRPLLTEDLVAALRQGTQTEVPDAVRDALALAFDMPPVYFHTKDQQIARLVVTARAVHKRYTAARADGGEVGMPDAARAELAGFFSDTVSAVFGPKPGDRTK